MAVEQIMAGACEVKSDVSQCLFEFLHMQVVSYFEESCGKEKSVGISIVCVVALACFLSLAPSFRFFSFPFFLLLSSFLLLG